MPTSSGSVRFLLLLCHYSAIIMIATTDVLGNNVSLISINVMNYYCPSLSIRSNETVSSLYHIVASCIVSMTPCEISIVFKNRIVLNVVNDNCPIRDIGLGYKSNDIQIIKKPDFAALLEMVFDLGNIQNIPWFSQAIRYISNASLTDFHSVSYSPKGLEYDGNGNLIGIDLSHLNLTGTIHLESLPPTIRSLNVKFNDLDSLNLQILHSKSLTILNVAHNRRCIINLLDFRPSNNILLYLSSSQIFPEISDLSDKEIRVRKWLNHQLTVQQVVVDGQTLNRGKSVSALCIRMLRVIEGVINKEVIPWYQPFVNGVTIQINDWTYYRIDYRRRRDGYPATYTVDLSGLGLEGRIDLKCLPKNVRTLDLSKNNLSGISFEGDKHCLEELNIRNNDHLRIHLTEIENSSAFRSFCLFILSSNQLEIEGATSKSEKIEFIREWLDMRGCPINKILIDENVVCTLGVPKPRNDPLLFLYKMLNMVKGVTNKERIPWYQQVVQGVPIIPQSVRNLGICYVGVVPGNRFKRVRSRCNFNLSGLALEGHIDLGYLSRNVVILDLSNNNLSTISFIGSSQNNHHLRIDLMEIDIFSSFCSLHRLNRLYISSYQLEHQIEETTLRQWMRGTRLFEIIIDDVVMKNECCSLQIGKS